MCFATEPQMEAAGRWFKEREMVLRTFFATGPTIKSDLGIYRTNIGLKIGNEKINALTSHAWLKGSEL